MEPNNFDLARLLLALTVVFYHCGDLSHERSLAIFSKFDARGAVEGFFAISGCLIFASWERTHSWRDYAAKRARRIFPAYYATTAFCLLLAFGLFHRFAVGKFLLANITFANFVHPGIDGVFANNPETSRINGVLWTIRIELMFYCVVPLSVWIARRVGRDRFLIATAALSILYRYVMDGKTPWLGRHPSLAVALPGQWSLFAVGALIYYHLPTFRRIGKWLAGPALLFYLIGNYGDVFLLRPLSIPVLVLGFCFLLPQMKGPARWGDFSYGTYLLHWPIIQTFVAFGWFARSPWPTLLLSLTTIAALAALSWFGIEKRMLRSGRATHLRDLAKEVEPLWRDSSTFP